MSTFVKDGLCASRWNMGPWQIARHSLSSVLSARWQGLLDNAELNSHVVIGSLD